MLLYCNNHWRWRIILWKLSLQCIRNSLVVIELIRGLTKELTGNIIKVKNASMWGCRRTSRSAINANTAMLKHGIKFVSTTIPRRIITHSDLVFDIASADDEITFMIICGYIIISDIYRIEFKQMYATENAGETESPTKTHAKFEMFLSDNIIAKLGNAIPIIHTTSIRIMASLVFNPYRLKGWTTIHNNLSNAINAVDNEEMLYGWQHQYACWFTYNRLLPLQRNIYEVSFIFHISNCYYG